MLAGPRLPVVFGRQGGSPPASFERLALAEDGTASYVAANAWPRLPPFGEVGEYAGRLDAVTLASLRRGLAAAAASSSAPARLHHDTGFDYLHAAWTDARGEWRWGPGAPPSGLGNAVMLLEQAAAGLRHHPLRTLAARLEPAPEGPHLVLAATGPAAFAVQAAPGAPCSVEVRLARISPAHARDWSWPARLVGLAPHGVATAPVEVSAGDAVGLALPAVAGKGSLACLVRTGLDVPLLDGTLARQEAWLMPAPLDAPA